MRLRRMAAGRRVYWQACVSAGPRCQRSSGARRSSVHRASDTFRWPSRRGALLDRRGTHPATIRSANERAPIWHVYPKDALRVALRIFVGYGSAGRGILKGQAK
jgi:hypothetical protein